MGPSLSDFLSQIPTFPIAIFCGSSILLIVTIALIIRARIVKTQEQFSTPSQAADFAYTPQTSASMSSYGDMGDLPDLDLLVGPTRSTANQAAPPPPAPQRSVNKGMYVVQLSDGGSTEAAEVMTILRDVVNGGLVIQMGDKSYRDLASDEDFKNGFLKVMRELSPMVKNAPASAPVTTSSENNPADENQGADDGDTQGISSPPSLRDRINNTEQPAPAAPPRPAFIPPTTQGGSVPGALPNYSLENQPMPVPQKKGLFGRGKLDLPPVPEINIAGSIETYLQHKLMITQAYPGRSIHVHPAPDGGVAIEVDGRFYEAVGDVADDDVRDFLRDSIQEWQQSH